MTNCYTGKEIYTFWAGEKNIQPLTLYDSGVKNNS